jgi:methanogenic corrinoid protein MtbC1
MARRTPVAEAVTEEFLGRHPDWLGRYGEVARRRGVEDAGFHLDFLAASIEAGSPSAFTDYVQWAARLLHARGIAPEFLSENLEQLARALASHTDPAEQEVVTAYIRAGREACAVPTAEVERAATDGELGRIQALFLQTILHGRRQTAAGLALEALRSHPAVDVYCEVLQESLYQVGRLWETSRITAADEHLATAIMQYVMVQMFERMEHSDRRRGKVVITGVEGEWHQVGANMVADVLEASGWDTWFLGTNLPQGGILRTIEQCEPGVLGVSMTMLFNLPRVRDLITAVRRMPGSNRPRIVVGGRAFRGAPDLWREVGADGYATDLRAALTLLCPPPNGRAAP